MKLMSIVVNNFMKSKSKHKSDTVSFFFFFNDIVFALKIINKIIIYNNNKNIIK